MGVQRHAAGVPRILRRATGPAHHKSVPDCLWLPAPDAHSNALAWRHRQLSEGPLHSVARSPGCPPVLNQPYCLPLVVRMPYQLLLSSTLILNRTLSFILRRSFRNLLSWNEENPPDCFACRVHCRRNVTQWELRGRFAQTAAFKRRLVLSPRTRHKRDRVAEVGWGVVVDPNDCEALTNNGLGRNPREIRVWVDKTHQHQRATHAECL